MTRALFVALALAAAGCVAAEEEAPAEPPTLPVCTDCEPPCEEAPCEAGAEPRATALSYAGRTPGYACVRALQCQDVQEGSFLGPPFGDGRPLRLMGNVSWSAQSDATRSFVVQMVVDMGDGWEWDPTREPEARGGSPVLVDWDLAQYPPGTLFSVYVETGTGTEHAWVAQSQDYTFEGVFVDA